MKDVIKFILVWSLCSVIALYTFKETKHNHKVVAGDIAYIVVFAPIAALVCTINYLSYTTFWSKCVIGCEDAPKN